MADNRGAKSDEREKKIPVFTVLKNNAILKNIFLLDNPPSFPEPKSNQTIKNGDPPAQEIEETLLVGRHPDCNITLEHPSISRFHLRIHTKPSSQKLSVIDLSSVHGTWISGQKIEPGVRVELNEGNTLQLGASSRVYSLHWIPLSRAYDLENPFVPQLDMPMQAEEREEEEGDEGIPQDDNCSLLENNQIESLDDDSECKHLAFSDENSKSVLNNVMPSAPPLPECINSPSFSDDEVENKCTWKKDHEQEESSSLLPRQLVTGYVDPSLSFGVLYETENQQFDKVNRSPRPPVDTEVLSEIDNPENTAELEQILKLLESLKSPFSNEQSENRFPLGENHDQREILSLTLQTREVELVNSSLPNGIVISRIDGQQLDEENQKPEPLASTEGLSGIDNPESPSLRLEQKSRLPESLNSSLSDEEEGHQNAEVLQNAKNQDPLRKDYEEREILLQSISLASESVSSSLPAGNILSKIESQQFNKANQSPCTPFATGGSQKKKPESPMIKSEQKSNLPSIWSRRVKPLSVLQIQIGRSRKKSRGPDISAEIVLHHDNIDGNSTSKALVNGSDGNGEAFTPDKENCSPNTLMLRSMKNTSKEEQIKDSKSHRPSSSLKNEEISKALFTDLDGDEEPFTPNKENFTPNTLFQKSMKKVNKVDEIKQSSLYRSSSAEKDGDEEPFTPDKENLTPNTLLLRSMKKINKIEEMKHSSLHRSSLQNAANPCIKIEENILAPSVTEKQTPKVLQEQKSQGPSSRKQESLKREAMIIKNRAERMPFQPLLVNSSGKSKSEGSVHSATTKSINSVNYVQTIEKNNSTAWEKMWYMVVDTTCLLNKESRKALQLLQGLKGTQLIIPRIVIRELDCMKRQGSLFRRKTEVFSALQWIEECMVSTNWWVHVQSSVEEGKPIAQTPPASPQSQYSETNGWFPSSLPRSTTLGSLLEIVSPTAEDHILECALLFRRIKNDGQLVLLTNDLTLKIKAMAEGMICETAEEFRESLVNPFSGRFLWADSTPRGLTWSCADDIVLRERYYGCCCFSGKAPKPGEGGAKGLNAKGLKLILLHNSRYAQALAS